MKKRTLDTYDFKARIAAIMRGANPDDPNAAFQHTPARSRAFLTRKRGDRETPSEALAAKKQQQQNKRKTKK